MKTEHVHFLAAAALLLLGVKIGQDRAMRVSAAGTSPTGGTVALPVDSWWSFAGSWAAS